MKIKIIKALSQDIEKEIQNFIDSLPMPSQIIDIKIGGDWLENHLAVVIINYI